MRIIEISSQSNGAHRNQSFSGAVPEGWAYMPEDVPAENFPFGTPQVSEIYGVMTVTAWTPGAVPEPEPLPEPEPTELERLRADVDYLLMMQEDAV